MNYKSYKNTDITAEYMPAITSNSAVLPLISDTPLETNVFNILFISSFSVLFLLSKCSKRFIRLRILLVLTEFLISRLILSYFKHEYAQLLFIRVIRFSTILLSLFLLFLSCFLCQCVSPRTKPKIPIKQRVFFFL